MGAGSQREAGQADTEVNLGTAGSHSKVCRRKVLKAMHFLNSRSGQQMENPQRPSTYTATEPNPWTVGIVKMPACMCSCMQVK